MKLLVIGHSVFDLIDFGSEHTEGAGGIYYTISALNRIKTLNDKIYLCSQFDDETYSFFRDEFNLIEKDYLQKTEKIPRVHLNLSKERERHESYENITTSLEVDYSNLNSFDGILINMITGFDISLIQLKQIRKNFNGKIFIDIHTLSRGLAENYKREFRKILDFNEWAENIDIIQANEHEVFTLSNETNEIKIANELLSFGVKIICVTKGEKGAVCYFMDDQKKFSSYFVSAKKIENAKAIGCGDVFGAVFFYNYILTGDVISSLKKAVNESMQLLKRRSL